MRVVRLLLKGLLVVIPLAALSFFVGLLVGLDVVADQLLLAGELLLYVAVDPHGRHSHALKAQIAGRRFGVQPH